MNDNIKNENQKKNGCSVSGLTGFAMLALYTAMIFAMGNCHGKKKIVQDMYKYEMEHSK